MSMSISDEAGRWINLGQYPLAADLLEPLVKERRERYSFPFGDMELVQITLPNIFIVYGDMHIRKEELRFHAINRPNFVELHFALSGGGVMENKMNGHKYNFISQQHNMLYTRELDGIGYYNTGQPYKFFEVHFTSEHFLNLVKDTGTLLARFCESIAKGKSVDLSDENQAITPEMHHCIRDIMNCRFQGGLKLLFLQAKCIELLTLQAYSFEKAHQSGPRSVLKSAHDKEAIHQAREYLIQNIDATPSLPELAKIVGINEFKLKTGFKEVFNHTVFGYLNEIRLLQAREQLLSGYPIKTIANELGYSSVQHFATAFRKKFGVPPGKAKQ
ncbi:helix-turn-helix domain-containing protein [Chitinophaga nivalis]|uniref:AraC family transcriptional regulator n=1 Tax=Chitinophaga nivalis TaxID=2991709 RepID=A0ABT3IT66_9BACT|nr:AraC family transcriptional regulator [Chitinophaga nivalis]MCW3463144.1 AraC family transcriptional regulator [Chitinophaga nivalis]MCW3487166.1 AraC family transcriptional regulator [Chitinophaga nivalis]